MIYLGTTFQQKYEVYAWWNCFWNMKTHIVLFHLTFLATVYFPMNFPCPGWHRPAARTFIWWKKLTNTRWKTMTKNMFIFVFKNYGKFLCIPLEHFKQHKPLSIAEEPLHELLMLSNTYPTNTCVSQVVQKTAVFL